jgi:serine/threonine-protein kinase
MELDETLADAHLALARVKGLKEWDFNGSQQGLRRALELNPNLAEAHVQYAWHLAIFGTQAEAIAEMRHGIELDPLSPLYTAWLGGLYWEFGRFEEAITQANKAMERQPDYPVALSCLGWALTSMGRFQEAIGVFEKSVANRNMNSVWTLARTYALAGRTADARKIMARLESGKPDDIIHPWFIASAYTALGENEKAMDWLEKAYATRNFFLPNLGRERAAGFDLRPLRTNSRFQALLRRIPLPR